MDRNHKLDRALTGSKMHVKLYKSGTKWVAADIAALTFAGFLAFTGGTNSQVVDAAMNDVPIAQKTSNTDTGSPAANSSSPANTDSAAPASAASSQSATVDALRAALASASEADSSSAASASSLPASDASAASAAPASAGSSAATDVDALRNALANASSADSSSAASSSSSSASAASAESETRAQSDPVAINPLNKGTSATPASAWNAPGSGIYTDGTGAKFLVDMPIKFLSVPALGPITQLTFTVPDGLNVPTGTDMGTWTEGGASGTAAHDYTVDFSDPNAKVFTITDTATSPSADQAAGRPVTFLQDLPESRHSSTTTPHYVWYSNEAINAWMAANPDVNFAYFNNDNQPFTKLHMSITTFVPQKVKGDISIATQSIIQSIDGSSTLPESYEVSLPSAIMALDKVKSGEFSIAGDSASTQQFISNMTNALAAVDAGSADKADYDTLLAPVKVNVPARDVYGLDNQTGAIKPLDGTQAGTQYVLLNAAVVNSLEHPTALSGDLNFDGVTQKYLGVLNVQKVLSAGDSITANVRYTTTPVLTDAAKQAGAKDSDLPEPSSFVVRYVETHNDLTNETTLSASLFGDRTPYNMTGFVANGVAYVPVGGDPSSVLSNEDFEAMLAAESGQTVTNEQLLSILTLPTVNLPLEYTIAETPDTGIAVGNGTQSGEPLSVTPAGLHKQGYGPDGTPEGKVPDTAPSATSEFKTETGEPLSVTKDQLADQGYTENDYPKGQVPATDPEVATYVGEPVYTTPAKLHEQGYGPDGLPVVQTPADTPQVATQVGEPVSVTTSQLHDQGYGSNGLATGQASAGGPQVATQVDVPQSVTTDQLKQMGYDEKGSALKQAAATKTTQPGAKGLSTVTPVADKRSSSRNTTAGRQGLPQTGDAKQIGVAVIGVAVVSLVSLLGLAGLAASRRKEN